MTSIASIVARQILDSRGYPTLEVDVRLDDGTFGRAAVPAGASTGSLESIELRDRSAPQLFGGRGTLLAVSNIEKTIGPALRGADALDQGAIDERLCALDGTPRKERLGANAVLGVSLAVARAAAVSRRVPLYVSLGGPDAVLLPLPMIGMIGGGVHADNTVDFQELMIAPVGAPSFREALRIGAESYQALKALLKERGYGTAIGDTGAFAPNVKSNEEAIELIMRAIEAAGGRPGTDVVLALDAAATVLFEAGAYVFRRSDHRRLSAAGLVDLWERWVNDYPIASIEDGLAEVDWNGWRLLTERLGHRVQLVGDDIFVTNPAILRRAISEKVGNAAVVKLNQIGTLSETLEAIRVGRSAGYGLIVAHRSGDTPDDFIAHLAVATSAGQIKAGAPCRGERIAKYNELLRIEQELGDHARYAGGAPFSRFDRRSRGTT